MIDIGRPAVIVVDVQNDFVHPAGKAGSGGSDMTPLLTAVEAINRLIGAARQSDIPVVYVRVTHSPALDAPSYRARYALRGMATEDLLCADGSWGAHFYEALDPPAPTDLIVTKHGYDGFTPPALADYLGESDVDTVIVTGVVTELCVMGTAAGGFERGFHVVVPREATGSLDPAAAEAALALIASFYGTVTSLEEVTTALNGHVSASRTGGTWS